MLAVLERGFSDVEKTDTMVSENSWYKILNKNVITWGDIFTMEEVKQMVHSGCVWVLHACE